jgi:hypothetical protein
MLSKLLIMLGNILYEQHGKISTYRVLDTENPTIETTITGIGIINGIGVTDIVTYWSKPSEVDRKTFYAEGKGVISTKYGEIATWKGYGIGRYNGRNRTDRGSVFFKGSRNGKLSLLNNKIEVFEYYADENGNTNGKILEWK